MKVTKRARQEAKQLFRSCLVDGRLDEARVRQAVAGLIDRRPRGFAAVLSHLHRLVKLDIARRTARVESAVALAPALQAEVTGNLTRLYGPGLEIAFAPNPALVGGMRVRVGSDVLDGSVQARLTALAERF
jgi:F-type H+-transporting ATPase subunit delta